MADGVWSIEANPASTQGYSIDPNTGKATFPRNNTADEITYTIKYTPNGAGAKSCERIVKQKGNPCSFTYTVNTAKIPLEGGDYEFGTLSNLGSQTITVKLTDGTSQYVNGNLTVSNGKVVGNVKSNDSGAETIPSRDIKYGLYVGDVQCGEGYKNTQDGKVCTCECTELSVSPTSLSWTYNDRTPKKITITPGCTKSITVDKTSSTSWFTVSDIVNNVITVTPSGENQGEEPKSGSIKIKFKACGNDCTAEYKTIPFTQGINECTCRSIVYTPIDTPIAYNAGEVELGRFTLTPSTCDVSKVALSVNDPDDVIKDNYSITRESPHIIYVNANPNTSGVNRQFSYTVTYDGKSNGCPSTSRTQTANVCECVTITRDEDSKNVYNRKSEARTIGKITFKDNACKNQYGNKITFKAVKYTYPDIEGIGERVDSNPITNFTFNPSTGVIVGTPTVAKLSRRISYKVFVDGVFCSEIYVYQRCWRGTDNGVDDFYGVEGETVIHMREEHPILLCGAEYYSSSDRKWEMPGDTDTIVVSGVQISCESVDEDGHIVGTCVKRNLDGTTEPISGWHPITEFKYDYNLKKATSLIYNDWLEVYWISGASYNSPYGSILTETLTDNLGSEERVVRFWLQSTCGENDLIIWTNPEEGGRQPSHHGEEACQKWEYPVMQSPRCYGWCKIGDNENRMAGIYDAGHSSCQATYEEWDEAIARGEKTEQIECHVQDTDPSNPNTERFKDCRQ